MAKQKDFFVSSKSVGAGGLHGKFELDTGDGVYSQDMTQFKLHAEMERQRQETVGLRPDGYRKFATIPDAVAIKIYEVHGLNLHDPSFAHDPNNMKKLKTIMMSEYRDLIVNT